MFNYFNVALKREATELHFFSVSPRAQTFRINNLRLCLAMSDEESFDPFRQTFFRISRGFVVIALKM